MAKSVLVTLFLIISAGCWAQKTDRIITAGSALTETVCALGDCSKIVASDKTSLYPPQIQSLPSIGYRSSIGAEGIIALQPTLFIAEKGYVDEAVLNQIRSTGIMIIVIERAYALDGTRAMIREIAGALKREKDGAQLIASIESEIAETTALLKKSTTTPRVLCVYNRGTSSVDIAGARTFSGILPYVGATAAISGIEGYKPLNAEALVASNPDYLLMFESGVQSLGGVDGVLRISGVLQTTAGKKRQVIAMDGIKLSNFGPRFGEAVRELALLLHPELQSR